MANQTSYQDENQNPTIIGVSGTAGTAEVRRVVVTDEGAIKVDLVSGDTINIGTVSVGTVSLSGTSPVSIIGGTINLGTVTGTVDIKPLNGAVLTTAVGVANGTATAIPTTTLTNRKTLICYNAGTVSVWLGGTSVTASNVGGIPVGTAEYSPSFDIGTAVLYGISASAGGTITIFEAS